MELLVCVINREEELERILAGFVELGITVHSARITTLGERIEDTFYITEEDDRRIEDPARIQQLSETISTRLDEALEQATAGINR